MAELCKKEDLDDLTKLVKNSENLDEREVKYSSNCKYLTESQIFNFEIYLRKNITITTGFDDF